MPERVMNGQHPHRSAGMFFIYADSDENTVPAQVFEEYR